MQKLDDGRRQPQLDRIDADPASNRCANGVDAGTRRQMINDRPAFTGITSYHDPGGRFSFRYPWDWHRDRLDQDRDGVMLRPDPDEPATYVAAWISPLPTTISAADLIVLKDGFDTGLRNLPSLSVIAATDEAFDDSIRLERVVRFSEDGTTRQRRIWAIYTGAMQLVIIFQGRSPDIYEYWLPMGNYCYATLDLIKPNRSETDSGQRSI